MVSNVECNTSKLGKTKVQYEKQQCSDFASYL